MQQKTVMRSVGYKATRGVLLLSSLWLVPACSGGGEQAKISEKPAATKHGLSEAQAKEPLIVVGDTTITVGEFAEVLAEKSPYLRARYASPERRRELLDELVKVELLALEASRRGLDASDEIVNTKKQVMIQQMMKAEFEDKVKLSDITDQEIEAYYNAHPSEFNKPAQVRASHILIKDEAKAKKVLKQVLAAPNDHKLFRELVAAQSEDAATASRFGDLQFLSMPEHRVEGEPEVPEAVVRVAFELTESAPVHPELVKSDAGFHIVKSHGQRKAIARSLEEARRPIQHKLWREKREALVESFVKSLREKAKIEENLSLLDQLKVELPPEAAAPEAPKSAKPKAAPKAAAKESPAP